MSIGMHKYKPGDEWKICDICGLKYRQSVMRKNWQNQIVCPEDYEDKHPQISIKSVREKIVVRDSRPEPTETYLSYGEVSSDNL